VNLPSRLPEGNRSEGRAKRLHRLRTLAWCVAIAFVPVLFFGAQFWRPGKLLNLIEFGEANEVKSLPEVRALAPPRVVFSGYDAQFYAQMALDPTLRRSDLPAAVDSLRYRSRRILLSVIAWVAGGGSTLPTITAFACLNMLFWLALFGGLVRCLKPADTRTWACIAAALLTTGVMDSFRRSLVDLPAATLLFFAAEWSLVVGGGFCLAAALLTRETSILGLGSRIDPAAAGWRRWLWGIGLPLAPAIVWWVYGMNFPNPRFSGVENLAWPMQRVFPRIGQGFIDFFERPNDRRLFLLLTPFCLFFQAAFLWVRRRPASPHWRCGLGFTALLLVLGHTVWAGNIGAARAMIPLTIAFNVLLAQEPPKHFWACFFAGNCGLLWGLRKLTLLLGWH